MEQVTVQHLDCLRVQPANGTHGFAALSSVLTPQVLELSWHTMPSCERGPCAGHQQSGRRAAKTSLTGWPSFPGSYPGRSASVSSVEVDLVRRHFEQMWNQRDFAACAVLIAENYLEHGAAPFAATAPGRVQGPTAMRETMEWLLAQFPDLSFIIEAMVAEDDLVVARVRATGSNLGRLNGFLPASGKVFDYTQSHWFRIADGKLAEHWATRDDLTAMLQLGVVTSPRLGALIRQLQAAIRHRLNRRHRSAG